MRTPYFEEITVGDSLPALKKGPISLTDLVKYSGASGDFNPLHTVPEYAKSRAGLPDVIGHGMLSMGYAGQLITDWMGPDGEVKRLKAQFRAMTFLNDEVTCEGVVADKRQTADGNLVDINIVLTAGRESRRTIVGSATVALPSKSKASTAKKKPAKKKPAKKKSAKKKTVKKKKATKKTASKRKATKRKTTKKTAAKKKTTKRKAAKNSPQRKSPKRKSPKRKATKKKVAKRRRR